MYRKKILQLISMVVLISFLAALCFGDLRRETMASQSETGGVISAKKQKCSITIYTKEEEIEISSQRAEEAQLNDFPIIMQMPELPTGCEITALTMVLNYYGYQVEKTVMATQYLPTTDLNLYYGNDGRLYGPDLNSYFIGDPASQAGYVCGTGAITTAADRFLEDNGSSLSALDISGTAPEELYQFVSDGIPVVVWVTIYMSQRAATQGWYTESGEYVEWSTNDHGAVLIGYTENTVTIADPISGQVEYDREDFEEIYRLRGSKCVVLT